MIIRISSIAVVLAVSTGLPFPSLAFQIKQSLQNNGSLRSSRFFEVGGWESVAAISALQMSSIPDDNESNNGKSGKNNSSWYEIIKNSLPPSPEDPIALTGDMLALFVYSYLDHITNQIYADTAAKMDVADLITYDPNNNSKQLLPVWFDPAHLIDYGSTWLANTHVTVPYAPAIAASGLAFVTMATSWIICGYFSGAFLSRNTLECNASNAMIVTLKTWAGTCMLMLALAYASDVAWGQLDLHFNALSAPARGGLTKADADFIFDSLTVLAFWRFMFNWLLGYNRR